MKRIAGEIWKKSLATNCAEYLEEVDYMAENEIDLLKSQIEALKKNVLDLDKTLWTVHMNYVNLQNSFLSQSFEVERLRQEVFKTRRSMRGLGRRSVQFEQSIEANLEGASRRVDFLMDEYLVIRFIIKEMKGEKLHDSIFYR